MVLAELGQRISQALGSLNSVTVVDEAVRPLPCLTMLPAVPPACCCDGLRGQLAALPAVPVGTPGTTCCCSFGSLQDQLRTAA